MRRHLTNLVSLLLATFLALSLLGCQSVIDSTDEAIRKNLPLACEVVTTTHSAFLTLNSIRPLKPQVVNAELVAYTDAAGYCAHPETATTMTALATVIRSSLAIVAALREAEKVEDAVTP